MPDIICVAIISIVGTLIAAGIGAFISGYSAYRNTKSQINARSAELKEQLEHQHREERRKWLVETRKEYLVPLRKTVGEWAADLTQLIDQIERLGMIRRRSKEYPFTRISEQERESIKQTLESLQARMKTLEGSKGKLEALRGQVNDEELNVDIDWILLEELEISNISFPILHFETQSWLRNPKEDIIKSLDDALQKIKTASADLRTKLQKVNRRIEELLVGDETIYLD